MAVTKNQNQLFAMVGPRQWRFKLERVWTNWLNYFTQYEKLCQGRAVFVGALEHSLPKLRRIGNPFLLLH